jgi:hypothetical protein
MVVTARSHHLWLILLAVLVMGGCAHTLRDAPFAVVVHEDAMSDVDVDALELDQTFAGEPVALIQIPLPLGWDRSLRGWSRPPLQMPPSLQGANLAKIHSACGMTAATVVRLHGASAVVGPPMSASSGATPRPVAHISWSWLGSRA